MFIKLMGWTVKKIHFIYILWFLFIILLFPLLFPIALYIRKTALRLPEAKGPQEGICSPNSLRKLSLVMIGESTIAGVGVDFQDQGLVANTAHQLSQISQRRVLWRAIGENGIDIRGTIDRLLPIVPKGPLDLIVICLGVNDTTGMTSLSNWQKAITELISGLQQYNPTTIFMSGLPPIEKFTALPQPLRFVLGLRAKLLQHTLQSHPLNGRAFHIIPPGPFLERDHLAIDGYHPSAAGYQFWGKKIAQTLFEYC